MEDIRERVQNIFRDIFDDDTIVLEEGMTAEDIEGWDSLTHFQMIMEVEIDFNIKFTTKEISNLATVGELLNLIEAHLNCREEK